jgi:MarR family transcriptional regulator, transcriptional regulator for hemolysin
MPRKPAPRVVKRKAPSKGDLDSDALLRLVWEIPRFWRLAMDRRLKPLGLSEAKWRTVLHLSRGPADISQAELASRMNIEAPTMARLLDRLAADGWVERRAAVNDRRIKTIHLLAKASSVIREINRTMNATRHDVLSGISPTQLRACLKTLQHIHSRAELASRVE